MMCSRPAEDLRKKKRKRNYLAGLVFLFVVGVALSIYGGILLSQFGSAQVDNIGVLTNGIGWDWFPGNPEDNVFTPEVDLTPSVNDSGLSSLFFVLNADLYSNTTFTFGFVSPYLILSKILFDKNGNWSYSNVENAGSVITFSHMPKLNSTLKSAFFVSVRMPQSSKSSDSLGWHYGQELRYSRYGQDGQELRYPS
jgi:hypothetical protein